MSLFVYSEPNETLHTDSIAEIVVVHSREQMLQHANSNTPSTFTLAQTDNLQITSAKDFTAFVPSLYIPEYGSQMTSTIYMRGLGARIDNPVVGVYVDGIGLANKNCYDFLFLDIRRVDVYRGPQGTMFGRNTIGGIINIQTLSPLLYQGTRARLSYANQNTLLAQASHYSKIGNHFGFALGGFYRQTDGYFVNVYDGKLTDWNKQAGAMLKLEYQHDDNFKLSNNATYNFVKQGAFPYHLEGQQVNHNDFCGYQRHNVNEGLNMEFIFDRLQLTSTTTYQFLLDKMDMDQDYMPLSYFTLQQNQKEHYAEQNFILQPLQEHVCGSMKWNWLAGAMVSYRHNTMSAPVHFMQDGIDSLILGKLPKEYYLIKENNFTVYSDFTTQFTDAALYHTSYFTRGKWQLEAGLRIDFEHSQFDYHSQSRCNYMFTPLFKEYKLLNYDVSGRLKNNYIEFLPRIYIEFLPRIAASFKNEHWKVFGSISEGYKAGGYNSQLFSDIATKAMVDEMIKGKQEKQDISGVVTYQPERCLSQEIGAQYRYSTDDLRLSAELRIYDNELFNQQLTIFPPNTTGRMMTNAGRSRSFGAELDFNLNYKGLSFEMAYGYTNARFLKYESGSHNYAGNAIPYIPAHTLAGGVAYRWQFEHDVCQWLSVGAQTKMVGPLYWDDKNTMKQQPYALLNANITLAMKYVSLSIWGQNLTNTQYNVFYFQSMGNNFMQSGKPITYGATISLEI